MSAVTRRQFVGGAGILSATALAACGAQNTQGSSSASSTDGNSTGQKTDASTIRLDSAAWQYNATDDVYYQLGITYCANPADKSYEQLAIFVPGAYFEAKDNGNGTFTCQPNDSKAVEGYTATTAPIVIPVETPGYSAQKPLSEYTSLTAYTGKGFVYVHAGCRGRESGAPAGIVDLKAAVRFLRASSANMAGSTDRIFTFGMSGGGAQSALMGATGDSELYTPYLQAIGAADASDAILGSMDWCPITGLDVADAAYEWMMGSTRTGLSEDEQKISDALAEAFATYLNQTGISEKGGTPLQLEKSDEGIYQAGSYYQRVLQAIETSLNDFLKDTTFPYEATSSSMGMGGPGGGPGGDFAGGRPDGGEMQGAPDGTTGATNGNDAGMGPGPDGKWGGARRGSGGQTPQTGDTESAEGNNAAPADGEMPTGAQGQPNDNISRMGNSNGIDMTGTYQTASDYIAALNVNDTWVTYDEATNTATITSVAAFCAALKGASKSLGAFDQLDRGQGENELFGVSGNPAHFDSTLASILEEQKSSYASNYASDLKLTDALGTSMQTRVNMYTPLYYLLPTSEGHGKSQPAKHWRIRSGINQGDTSLTTELNLALALESDSRVQTVDFAAVWGQGHTKAERTGTSDENFITWVNTCLKQGA